MAAGIEGRALYVASVLYSSRELTDGEIADVVLPALAALSGVRRAKRTAEELVAIGLWERTDRGYVIHDYLDYNPSRDQVLAERGERRDARVRAGRAGGLRSGEVRRSKGEANAKQKGSNDEAKDEANAKQKGSPVPLPLPQISPERANALSAPSGGDDAPLPGPVRTQPTEGWEREMRAKYGSQLRDFGETLRFAMNSEYYRRKPDKCAYLEGQLKRAVERESARQGAQQPGGNQHGRTVNRPNPAGGLGIEDFRASGVLIE